ncbi:MAG: deaminase [bacterium]|nr:deaminase [bacterium]
MLIFSHTMKPASKKNKTTLPRPSWDELFVAKAILGSSRGSCDRKLIACILVNNKKIVGSGYNGSMAGTPTCDEVGHDILNNHCVRTLHAEVNSLANSWGDLHGATAYVTATPCLNCVKDLGQHGISRIVYAGHYDNQDDGRIPKYCEQKKISLEQICGDAKDAAAILSRIFTKLNGKGGIFEGFNVRLVPVDTVVSKAGARIEKKWSKK